MKSASVSKLKASLSEYLTKVKKGEEVVVTDRRHPIAKLIPFRSKGKSEKGERERLVREGIIEPGKTGKISPALLKESSVKDPKGLLLKFLLEERREGR